MYIYIYILKKGKTTCMYTCIHVWMYVCMYVFMYVCICVCARVCVHTYIDIRTCKCACCKIYSV